MNRPYAPEGRHPKQEEHEERPGQACQQGIQVESTPFEERSHVTWDQRCPVLKAVLKVETFATLWVAVQQPPTRVSLEASDTDGVRSRKSN